MSSFYHPSAAGVHSPLTMGRFLKRLFHRDVFFQASRALTVRPKFPQATVSPTKQLHKLEWEKERMNKNGAKCLWGTLCSAVPFLTAPLIHQPAELPNSTRIFHAQSSWEYLMFIPICWWPLSTKAHSQIILHFRRKSTHPTDNTHTKQEALTQHDTQQLTIFPKMVKKGVFQSWFCKGVTRPDQVRMNIIHREN